MIIGYGQLAKSFRNYLDKDTVVFASGVSNSNCTDIVQFEREKHLLISTLKTNQEKKFVYFSSCALSADEYPKNDYYRHKKNMEELIKMHSNKYYIFRLPQLFGELILHKTLINFIYKAIEHQHKFNVFDEAYRYVIEISDVRKLVEAYLKNHDSTLTVDLANPYRYKVLDIVHTFEKILDKKAYYELIPKEDQYLLDLSDVQNFVKNHKIDIQFGKNYLINNLKEKLQ